MHVLLGATPAIWPIPILTLCYLTHSHTHPLLSGSFPYSSSAIWPIPILILCYLAHSHTHPLPSGPFPYSSFAIWPIPTLTLCHLAHSHTHPLLSGPFPYSSSAIWPISMLVLCYLILWPLFSKGISASQPRPLAPLHIIHTPNVLSISTEIPFNNGPQILVVDTYRQTLTKILLSPI